MIQVCSFPKHAFSSALVKLATNPPNFHCPQTTTQLELSVSLRLPKDSYSATSDVVDATASSVRSYEIAESQVFLHHILPEA
jgi:hypothetical protein